LAPTIKPYSAPLVAPAPVVRSVRFWCDVAPQQESCREHTETPDGGGDDSECNCMRDHCYYTDTGRHICEKQ
jgi:hypothetical protein